MSDSNFAKPNPFRVLLLTLTLGLLNACGNQGVEVTTFLASSSKIELGAAVYFDDKQIGEVSDVVEEAAGSRVALMLDNQAAQTISRQSAVVVNSLKQGSPLEIYNPSTPSSDEALVSGQEIKGLDSMFQLGAWMVGDAFKAGSGSVNQYVQAFQDYLKGDQFEQDKAAVKTEIDNATSAANEAISRVEEDLTLTINGIKLSEDEMATALQELGDELSPLVQELSKTGVELMQELEKFALNLENTTPEQQQYGEKFLQSLEATLEQLNTSIEKGAEQAENSD